jgi:hypothetical protein
VTKKLIGPVPEEGVAQAASKATDARAKVQVLDVRMAILQGA